MSAVALLKFYQASPTPITGDGEALKVVAGNAVNIQISDTTDVDTWSLELLYAPPGSTHGPITPGSPSLLDSGSDPTFLDYNFTPDVPGAYRFRLTVADGAAISDVDIRCIAVTLANGNIPHPYQRDPLPLESSEKPNEENYGGQPWGWAGDETDSDHPMGNAVAIAHDRLDFDYGRTIFVGKHGADTNDGLSPSKAKLTFASAATAASALSPAPSATNPASIVCQDSGVYAGFTVPAYVRIYAPEAFFESSVVVSSYGSIVEIGTCYETASGKAIDVTADRCSIKVKQIRLIGGSSVGIYCSGSDCDLDVSVISCEGAASVGVEGDGVVSLRAGAILLGASNTKAIKVDSGYLTGLINLIYETGAVSGTVGIDATGTGGVDLFVGFVQADAAIEAASNVAAVFAGEVVGSVSGGNVRLVDAFSVSKAAADYSQAVFFGKHGSDSNSGLSPGKAKLTYGAAVTAAEGLSPGSSNQIAIVCLDGGTYTGGSALPTYCHLFAPHATFTSGITVPYAGSSMKIGELQIASGPGIHVTSAAVGARVEVGVVRAQGGGTSGIQVTTATNVRVKADRVIVEGSGAYGVHMVSGEAFFEVGEIAISNNGSFGVWVQAGSLAMHAGAIHEVGSYAAVQAVMVTGGSANLIAELISADTAISCSANPTNVFAAEVNGTVAGSGLSLLTSAGGSFDYAQTIFIGKHGNDSNDGLNPSQAKLTYGSAMTAASGLSPSSSNQIAVVCVDGGSYGGLFTVPSYVHVIAPSASFNQTITMSSNSSLRARSVSMTSASGVILSGDEIEVELKDLQADYATGSGIVNSGSKNRVRIGLLNVSAGSGTYGINCGTSSTREILLEIGEILLSADSAVALYCTAGTVSGFIGRIIENGSHTNTVGIQGAGSWNLFIGQLSADTAANTGAGYIELVAGWVTGTLTGDNQNVLVASHASNAAIHVSWPLEMSETSAPGTPDSGKAYLYLDSADGDAKIKFDNDQVVTIADKT